LFAPRPRTTLLARRRLPRRAHSRRRRLPSPPCPGFLLSPPPVDALRIVLTARLCHCVYIHIYIVHVTRQRNRAVLRRHDSAHKTVTRTAVPPVPFFNRSHRPAGLSVMLLLYVLCTTLVFLTRRRRHPVRHIIRDGTCTSYTRVVRRFFSYVIPVSVSQPQRNGRAARELASCALFRHSRDRLVIDPRHPNSERYSSPILTNESCDPCLHGRRFPAVRRDR